jgi:hypothetical protein
MDTAEVMELRARAGFVTPLVPLERGNPTLIFSSRGSFEWLMHPDDAFHALIFGVAVDGRTLKCSVVDAHPLMNALTVQAKDPDGNVSFIQPAGSALKEVA